MLLLYFPSRDKARAANRRLEVRRKLVDNGPDVAKNRRWALDFHQKAG